METPEVEYMWKIEEFADAHGISKSTVYNLIRSGKLIPTRLGPKKLRRIAESERQAWLARSRCVPTPEPQPERLKAKLSPESEALIRRHGL